MISETKGGKGIKVQTYTDIDGRGGEIRTPDPLVPNQMRYQTALRPDKFVLVQIIIFGNNFFYLLFFNEITYL